MTDFDLLVRLGWKPYFQQQLSFDELDTSSIARVIAIHRAEIVLHDGKEERRLPVTLFDMETTVGDWWLCAPADGYPQRRLERQSELARKASGTKVAKQGLATNIDTLFIVSSCNADFNESRLERYLSLALQAQVFPVVVLTKSDLCNDPEEYRQRAARLHSGLVVECVNALDASSFSGIRTWCSPGQTVALLGSSGVGKSTITNTLTGANLVTADIREDDARGRHTTTHRSLHTLLDGGVLIDTPGMRELQLVHVEDGIEEVFAEIAALANNCRFANCQHEVEPGCAVRTALETGTLDQRRWQNYQKLLREQMRNSRTLAESHEYFQKQGKLYKQIQNEHRKRKGNE